MTRLDIASERFDLEHSHRRSFADQWRGVCSLRIRLPWRESGNNSFIEPITRIDAQASHRFSVGPSQGRIPLVVRILTDDCAKFHQADAFSTTTDVRAGLSPP